MLFQIYTMYVNRKDVLARAIESLGHYQDRAVILDNSRDQALTLDNFRGEIIKPCVPLFCNQSYNLILALAQEREQPVFFIMHSDALASPEVVQAMLERARFLNEARRRWSVLFSNYDILCLCNTKELAHHRWDLYLPVYYTDVDFYYRLKLAGIPPMETHLPVGHQEGGSTTLQADPALQAFVQANFGGWRHYYQLKWGGERDHERFTTPFNQ